MRAKYCPNEATTPAMTADSLYIGMTTQAEGNVSCTSATNALTQHLWGSGISVDANARRVTNRSEESGTKCGREPA